MSSRTDPPARSPAGDAEPTSGPGSKPGRASAREPEHIVIAGGSMAGLAAAVALHSPARRITVLEREALPECDSPLEAFERWERRGAPQTRHSHAFLARLNNLIAERVPELHASLLAHGAEPLRFVDMAREVFGEAALLPEDDEIELLGCRRITFDWVLRRHVQTLEHVDLRSGARVAGLVGERDGDGRLRVRGVRLHESAGGAEIPADLVIDAMGRNSPLKHWLEELDAPPMEEESESCGIFYCSRFYRIHPDAERPPMEGPIGGDLGYMKYAIFQGDSDIFSVTLAASPRDDDLRRVRDADVFQTVASHLPPTRSWVDPAVSTPITDVYVYANLKNTRRHFLADGEPRALGVYPIGDALLHANPIAGRGCTIGWLSAYLLADAWEAAGGDLLGFARRLDADLEREIVPAWRTLRDQDRATAEMNAEEKRGEDPFAFERDDGTIDPKAYMRSLMRDGLVPALEEDIVVLRAFMRVFNLLSAPNDLMADPDLFGRVLAVWNRRDERERKQRGPGRKELVALLGQAA